MLTEEESKLKARKKLGSMLATERQRLARIKAGGVQWRYFTPEQVKQLRIDYTSKIVDQLDEIVGLLD